MYKSIVLKIPSNVKYIKIAKDLIKDTCKTLPLTKDDTKALLVSAEELIHNAIVHAYQGKEGYIEISLHPFDAGIRIDVHDWGIPVAEKKLTSVPLDKNSAGGFNRIYHLVDDFKYYNLGREGKKFVIIKYASHPLHSKIVPSTQVSLSKNQETNQNAPVTVREFREGDEEGIARLIYKNYGYSYIKDIFYYPKKILELHGRKFYSIVTQSENKIIGHFAILLISESTIAEIGIAVVDPAFRGRGIMNRMMDLILKKAEDIGLDAVFGEAIMFHPYSQKSNLRHNFSESALMLGKIPEFVTLEGNKLSQKNKRGAVLVGYRFFNKFPKELYLPEIYKEQIEQTYKNAKIPFTVNNKKDGYETPEHIFLTYDFNPVVNVATIRIDEYGNDFKYKFLLLLSQLRAKHCDMIYADISLENIPHIDKVVKILNEEGFFYSGIMFLYHKKFDFLRLQLKNSERVGSKNYVCYSEFCKELSKFIQEDEKRIMNQQ